MVNEARFVSVIMPCRQEERYIAQALASIVANDYPRDRLEVLVVDGMSTDGTREIIADFSRRHPFIRLLDNPKKITPAALNIGIAEARGDVIMRMDCHSVFPPDYISGLVAWQEKTGADNVGGVILNLPANDTPMARAIAAALSHPFGVGNSHYRVGTAAPRWVDTVPFGCYRREVFGRVGPFDEAHLRTEDDEFNLRLKKQGGRLLLIPDIIITYFGRETLPQIWRMYYQYGYFKALVARKLGWVLRLRHLIPSLLVLALALSFLMGRFFPALRVLGGALFWGYVAADAAFAWLAGRREGLAVVLRLALVFPALHFAYGVGFLKGCWDFFLLGKPGVRDAEQVPISR